MLFANNARGTLAASLAVGGTSVTLNSGEGLRFGSSPTAGEFLRATLRNAAGSSIELVNITTIVGDTLTIVRAQESTLAQSFSAGDTISIRLTRESLTRLGQKDADEAVTGNWTVPTPTGTFSITPKSYVDNLVAATASGVRGRNRFVNGSMRVDQRNEGALTTIATATSTTAIQAHVYAADQWFASFRPTTSSASSCAARCQRFYTNEPYPATVALTLTLASVACDLYFGQRVEHTAVVDFAGANASIGFDMTLSTGSTVEWYVYRPNTPAYRMAGATCFGTLASPAKTLIASGTWTGVSTSFSRKTATFAVPSGVSGGIGGLEVLLRVPAATVGAVWTIAGSAQLEKADAATAFEFKAYSDEIADCLAFYSKSYPPGATVTSAPAAAGYVGARTIGAATEGDLHATFPVEMFKYPTFTWYAYSTGTANAIRNVSTSGDIAVTTTQNIGTRHANWLSLGTTPTSGNMLAAHWTAEAVIP
jgi:hypothetical protein